MPPETSPKASAGHSANQNTPHTLPARPIQALTRGDVVYSCRTSAAPHVAHSQSDTRSLSGAGGGGSGAEAASGAGLDPTAPLDLIYGHLTSQAYRNEQGQGFEPIYAAKLTSYQDGTHRLKVGLINDRIERAKDFGLGTGLPRRKEGELEEDDLRRSVARTKAGMYDRLRQIQADRLLTLTVRDNVTGLDQFKGYVQRFLKGIRSLPFTFHYVAVFEQQKRGAWHVHFAIQGFKDVRILRRLWLSIVKQVGGNVDISRMPTRTHRLCAYLVKYIAKNIEAVGLNKKRYWSSKGIPNPEKNRFYMHSRNIEGMLKEVAELCAFLGLNSSPWLSPDGTVVIVDS